MSQPDKHSRVMRIIVCLDNVEETGNRDHPDHRAWSLFYFVNISVVAQFNVKCYAYRSIGFGATRVQSGLRCIIHQNRWEGSNKCKSEISFHYL